MLTRPHARALTVLACVCAVSSSCTILFKDAESDAGSDAAAPDADASDPRVDEEPDANSTYAAFGEIGVIDRAELENELSLTACTIDTTMVQASCDDPIDVEMESLPSGDVAVIRGDVISFHDITTVTGSRPLIVIGQIVNVFGQIDAGSGIDLPGPGQRNCTVTERGDPPEVDAGGGGAGFGSIGAFGGDGNSANGGVGGSVSELPDHLVAGCASRGPSGDGAAGGGAIQLIGLDVIVVDAPINAGGAGGSAGASDTQGGTGGGSGGMIVIDSPRIILNEPLSANGGGGGGGGHLPTSGTGADAIGVDCAPGGGDQGGGIGGCGSDPALAGDNGTTGGGGGGAVGFLLLTSNPEARPPVASSPPPIIL